MTRKSNRIGQVWAWLPAFRAVAETQHLPTAAREFHLSVSALSRAVKSLEEQLERPLFIREGRSLTLSPAGRVLLGAVRDAMRRIDEGLTSIDGNAMKGAFIVASRGPYGSIFILPALDRLAEPYPDLIPCFESLPTDLVVPRLLEGSVDLVVSDEIPDEDASSLEVHLLGRLHDGIYAGPHHPLYRAKTERISDVLKHPFVVPPAPGTDHFPPHLKRRIGMVTADVHHAVQACASGRYLAHLPDAVAEHHGQGVLDRLPIRLGAPRAVYAIYRPILLEPSRVRIVRDAIEEAVRGASHASRAGTIEPAPASAPPWSDVSEIGAAPDNGTPTVPWSAPIPRPPRVPDLDALAGFDDEGVA